MNGILLFHKPVAWTSHDAVGFVRGRLGSRLPAGRRAKVGHAGTLDPMATGLLLILVGEATRQSASLSGLDKDYRGIFELGIETDTQDLEGRILRTAPYQNVTRDRLERAMAEIAARTEQVPPAFSAIKRGGRPMYKLARQNAAVGAIHELPLQLDARPAAVHEARLERFDPPDAEFFLRVAKGFYVRTFCHDVGEKLGCGAALACLVRTRIGPYSLEDALHPHDWDKHREDLQRFFRPAP